MKVYRICKTYPPDHDPIDGLGAFQKGGRWNSKGTYAVYTAGTLALARAELARHVSMDCIPDGFRVYEIEIPDTSYIEIGPLPSDWDDDPPSPASQRLGDSHLKNPSVLCLKIRSVCDPDSFNFVLNPMSKAYSEVKILDSYAFKP